MRKEYWKYDCNKSDDAVIFINDDRMSAIQAEGIK